MKSLNEMKRLNIFVDETGEFGFSKGSAKLYGVSLVFHEQKNEIKARYYTLIINKKNSGSTSLLRDYINDKLNDMIYKYLEYLQGFDRIVLYYDGGQADLSKAIEKTFGALSGYERRSKFDHADKKLFQVADMLTYLDKLIYKYNKNIKLTKTEQRFFTSKRIRTAAKELKSHQL